MDVTTLRWFQQVADGTTVTDVAALEGVTQPGVSRALTRLEAEVGTPLLRRSGRTLSMTRAGATYKRHVDRVLHELDDAAAALLELESPDAGTVSVAFQLSLGTWLVPHLVATFRARSPDVRFELFQIRDELSSPTLRDRSVDVEISTVRPEAEGVRWRPLLSEPLRLAVPRDHRLAGHHSVALEVAAADPFVMMRRTYALRRTSERLCQEAGFTPSVAFEGDDLPTVEGLVGAGLGVAIVPTSQHEIAGVGDHSVRYLELTDPGASREIGILWSTERRLLPAAERFRRHVLNEVRARRLASFARPQRLP